jgi:hypothetical protein
LRQATGARKEDEPIPEGVKHPSMI